MPNGGRSRISSRWPSSGGGQAERGWRDRGARALDRLEQIAFVDFDAHEIESELRAGDGGGPEAHERVQDQTGAFEAVQAQAHLGQFGRERRRVRSNTY